MEIPLSNPPQCRLCKAFGHRTANCPELSDEGDQSVELVGEASWDQQVEMEQRLAEDRETARKEASKNMELDFQPRGRGPAARASAAMGSDLKSKTIPTKKKANQVAPRASGRINRALPLSEEDPDQKDVTNPEDIQGLTAEELQMIYRRRNQQVERTKQKLALQALTGHMARYPSLSNVFSDDLACNVMKSTCSRLRTYLWKKLVWQLKVKEAVKIESKGKAVWKKNPRWLSLLLSNEVASLWGHFGAMRQKLRSRDFLAPGHGQDTIPNVDLLRDSSRG